MPNNSNSGHFYNAVSHQQGWAYHALQDQQKCMALKPKQ